MKKPNRELLNFNINQYFEYLGKDKKKECEEHGLRMVYLLNPHLYKNPKEKIDIELTGDSSSKPLNIKPTILGIIGLVGMFMHALEHQAKVIDGRD